MIFFLITIKNYLDERRNVVNTFFVFLQPFTQAKYLFQFHLPSQTMRFLFKASLYKNNDAVSVAMFTLFDSRLSSGLQGYKREADDVW